MVISAEVAATTLDATVPVRRLATRKLNSDDCLRGVTFGVINGDGIARPIESTEGLCTEGGSAGEMKSTKDAAFGVL